MRCIYLYFLPTTITECGSIGLLSSTDYQSDADSLSGTFLSSKMSGNRITIHQFVLAVVTALVLCAVCVGGVCGATYYASDEAELRYYIELANSNSGADTIIITDNIVLDDTQIKRYWWGTRTIGVPLEITSDITIMNEPGSSYAISTNYAELTTDDFSIIDYAKIDSYTIFDIKDGGTLTVTGNEDGGTLTVTTNQNGRAFDVNDGGTLVIQSGSVVTNSGFASNDVAESNNGGAVYVREGGTLIMSGGLLSENKAGAGGAVYVESGGKFTMTGGQITENQALNSQGNHDGYGGGVWAENSDCLDFSAITHSAINMNSTPYPDGMNYNDVYCPGFTWNEDVDVGEDDKPVFLIHDGEEVRFTQISGAYDAAHSTDIIYIDADIYQGGAEAWESGSSQTNTLEKITVKKSITIMPSGKDVTLKVSDTMFVVEGSGFLTFADSDDNYKITISAAENNAGTSNGGLVYVNGGSFTLSDNSVISGMDGINGGAVYLSSGSVTLSDSASITECTATENGAAVYVAGGTFTVEDSASVDASNDVYLATNQVITAGADYTGTIGEITLSSYTEGTKVVDVKTDTSGYPNQFALNPDSKDEDGEKILILESGSPNYLVISIKCYYEITIPPELIVNDDEPEYIVADILELAKNTCVNVIISGDFLLDYVNAPEGLDIPSVAYSVLTDGRVLASGDIVVSFSQENRNQVPINAVYTGPPPAYAGDYADKLTFTFEPVES